MNPVLVILFIAKASLMMTVTLRTGNILRSSVGRNGHWEL